MSTKSNLGMCIVDLPIAVLESVCHFLSIPELAAFYQTSKIFKKAAREYIRHLAVYHFNRENDRNLSKFVFREITPETSDSPRNLNPSTSSSNIYYTQREDIRYPPKLAETPTKPKKPFLLNSVEVVTHMDSSSDEPSHNYPLSPTRAYTFKKSLHYERQEFVSAILTDRRINMILWIHLSFDENFDTFKARYFNVVRHMVIQGIPPKFRGKIWQLLTGSYQLVQKSPDMYKFCSGRISEELEFIKRDIGRTFPQHPSFKTDKSIGQTRLSNVLNAFANFNLNKEVPYCQGLNFICGILILVLSTEEEAFWMMIQMMKTYDLEIIYSRGMPGLFFYTNLFDKLLGDHVPAVSHYFKSKGVNSSMFASKWILTIYSCIMPVEVIYRIWDIFMMTGWEIILRIGLAMLQKSEAHLLTLQPEDMFVYFTELPTEVLHLDSLLQLAYSYQFPPATIQLIQQHEIPVKEETPQYPLPSSPFFQQANKKGKQ